MMPGVDPARDFYRFATGNWLRHNPIPADKTRWAGFDELLERNFRLLHSILDEASAPSARRSGSEQRVGDFYRSSLDWKERDRKGVSPVLPDIERIRRIDSSRGAARFLVHFHEVGDATGFAVRSAPDWKDSSRYILYLNQGGLSLPDREYYLSDRFSKIRKGYQRHLQRMFRFLNETETDARRDARTVLDLETALARSSRKREDLRDPLTNYHLFSPASLARSYPHFPWKEYFSDLGNPGLGKAVIGQPEFFSGFDQLLVDLEVDAWKTYFSWRAFHGAAPYLDHAVFRENFDFFQRKLIGQKKPKPDWRDAAQTIDRLIGEDLGEIYVRKHFPPEARLRMQELVRDLQDVFRDRLAGIPWMSEPTRREALKKFRRFTPKIGYPDKFRDYSGVQIDAQDLLGNVVRSAQQEFRRRLRRVGKTVDRTEWLMTPPTVNAYFSPSLNEIVFPAGILQPPFFDMEMDDAVNYGAIGVVIGHEMTHGYDDQGRKFDAEGNLRDWWVKGDAQEFERRSRRIERQYSSYEPLPKLHVNGKLTKGENIADLGGVSIAFEALERRIRTGRTPGTKIEGYTPQQRFFLAYAQTWREKMRPELLRQLLTTDPHSPGPCRGVGPLVNFPPFWKAFDIAPGTPMRLPESRRTRIW